MDPSGGLASALPTIPPADSPATLVHTTDPLGPTKQQQNAARKTSS